MLRFAQCLDLMPSGFIQEGISESGSFVPEAFCHDACLQRLIAFVYCVVQTETFRGLGTKGNAAAWNESGGAGGNASSLLSVPGFTS